MLPPHESIATAKEQVLKALNARGLKDINGDPVSSDPSDIELGVPVDKNDLDKGWTRLQADEPAFGEEKSSSTRRNTNRGGGSSVSLQAADLKNGQLLAFRFRESKPEKTQGDDKGQPDLDDIEHEFDDPGWDVIVPSLDDYDEEEVS